MSKANSRTHELSMNNDLVNLGFEITTEVL